MSECGDCAASSCQRTICIRRLSFDAIWQFQKSPILIERRPVDESECISCWHVTLMTNSTPILITFSGDQSSVTLGVDSRTWITRTMAARMPES